MEGYSGIVKVGNMEMPVDDYLKMVKKQKDHKRQKQRRGKNNYDFPEDNGDEYYQEPNAYNPPMRQTSFNDYSDDDAYAGNPFAHVSGPKRKTRSNDQFEDHDDQKSSQKKVSSNSSGTFTRPRRNPFGSGEPNGFYGGNQQQQQMNRGGQFGGQQQMDRGNQFGQQQMSNGDLFDYQQPMNRGDQSGSQQQSMNRGDPFGRQPNGFPKAKSGSSRRRDDPFSRHRGFNDDDDDDY